MASEKCDLPCENSEEKLHKLSVDECAVIQFRFDDPFFAMITT